MIDGRTEHTIITVVPTLASLSWCQMDKTLPSQTALADPFRAVLDALPVPVYATDTAGCLTYYNDAAAALWGSRPALNRSDWRVAWTLYRPDGRPMPQNERPMAIALRERRPLRDIHAIAERPDGTRVSFLASPTPIFDEAGALTGAVNMLVDVTERHRAAEQQSLFISEIKHRTKNLAAVIDAIGRQTRPKNQPVVDAFFESLMGRMRAVLSMGEILFDSSARLADLKRVIETTLQPFQETPSRITFEGPPLVLSEQTGGGLALAFHELATNAVKYGALKTPEGKVSISWTVAPADSARQVRIEWRENGPNVVREPETRGFGSRVIGVAVSGEREGRTHLTFEPDGVRCRFEFLME